ncbi:hypothetical protein GCM10023340_06000 [Nocardioides marinquilinus]|uniref:NERD domain-containing protein n=1 Tax=Nocardioides marinquilinus TaxID=1210400 RepID=A0ABP9PBQ1_9ACTN
MRRNTRPMAYLAATAVALGVALWALFEWFTPMSPASWYLLGVLHVLLAGSFVGVCVMVLVTTEPDRSKGVAWGEEYTRDELRHAHRRRIVRHALHDITLDDGDVDHLVVTRHGGVVAMDSKYRSSVEPGDLTDLAASAAAVAARARQLLGGMQVGGGRGPAPSVRAVLVLWGKGQKSLDLPVTVDGVEVVRGPDLVEWLRVLDDERRPRRESRVLVRELTRAAQGGPGAPVRHRPRARAGVR